MSDENTSVSFTGTNGLQPVQSPHGSDSQMETACTAPPSASSNPPSSPSTPNHFHSGLTSGPRVHPPLGDRPNSAPPQQLEKLSGVFLRTMGDRYQTSTYGRNLRLMGDQMTFDNEIRRVLSYSDLDRYWTWSNENR